MTSSMTFLKVAGGMTCTSTTMLAFKSWMVIGLLLYTLDFKYPHKKTTNVELLVVSVEVVTDDADANVNAGCGCENFSCCCCCCWVWPKSPPVVVPKVVSVPKFCKLKWNKIKKKLFSNEKGHNL